MADTLEKPGYEEDFYLWTQAQAAALRRLASERVNAAVDWENVAEEIESVGRSDRHRVEGLAFHIMVHLIKLAASPAERPRAGWKREIRAARERLRVILRDSPSLRAALPSMVENAWPRALAFAGDDLIEFGEGEASNATLASLAARGPVLGEVIEDGFFPSAIEPRNA